MFIILNLFRNIEAADQRYIVQRIPDADEHAFPSEAQKQLIHRLNRETDMLYAAGPGHTDPHGVHGTVVLRGHLPHSRKFFPAFHKAFDKRFRKILPLHIVRLKDLLFTLLCLITALHHDMPSQDMMN